MTEPTRWGANVVIKADEYHRLRAENERLRGALDAIAQGNTNDPASYAASALTWLADDPPPTGGQSDAPPETDEIQPREGNDV